MEQNLKEFLEKVENSYKKDVSALKPKGIFRRKPKLAEVKEPTQEDPVTLPSWITNKKYVSENADAIKYNPALLLGALAKTYDDNSFDIYSVTYNVRLKDDIPALSKIEKPTNFYEQTFNQGTRFNSNFIIGGASISHNEIIKITYTETNFGNLEKYDEEKINELRENIQSIDGVDIKDWAIIRGVVLLDCTLSKNQETQIDVNAKASWITADGKFYRQTGNTDNFRLLSIDLENLFLQP